MYLYATISWLFQMTLYMLLHCSPLILIYLVAVEGLELGFGLVTKRSIIVEDVVSIATLSKESGDDDDNLDVGSTPAVTSANHADVRGPGNHHQSRIRAQSVAIVSVTSRQYYFGAVGCLRSRTSKITSMHLRKKR